MEAWRNLGQEPVVCHNRMRAVSLGEDDTSSITSKLSTSGSEQDVMSNSPMNDNTFSLKSYISNITRSPEKPVESFRRGEMMNNMNTRLDMNENRSMSWKERQNDYSFMKR